MSRRKLFAIMGSTLLIFGCATAPEPIVPIYQECEPQALTHPVIATKPFLPDVSVKVLTTETVKTNTAYVGFEYNDWLKFAQWIQQYHVYTTNLEKAIKLYRAQDKTLPENKKSVAETKK